MGGDLQSANDLINVLLEDILNEGDLILLLVSNTSLNAEAIIVNCPMLHGMKHSIGYSVDFQLILCVSHIKTFSGLLHLPYKPVHSNEEFL